MSKNKEPRYSITPKGFIYLIENAAEEKDYELVLIYCKEFKKWCDENIVYKEK